MKNTIKRYAIVFLCTIVCTDVMYAQSTQSGYFNDGYLFRYEMNPAFANESGFVGMPGISNMNVAMRGNVGVETFLYNVDGRTTTFLNPKVSASEFLDKVKDNNRVNEELKLNILNVGFKGMGGYNIIGINVRERVSTRIPGSIFRLAKEGPKNSFYDITDFDAQGIGYGEIALGHSHQISNKVRIGATLKVLLGYGQVDATFNKAQLLLNNDAYTAITNAEINSSVKGLQYKTETTERGPEGHKTPHTYVNGADLDNTGLNGWGTAIDLGMEWKINEDWRLSAALLDLGFISWKETHLASTNGDRIFETDKYIFNFDDESEHSFEREGDRLLEGLATLYELQDNGDAGSRTTMLGATLNVGGEYILPSYKNLSFGLLSTTRINGIYSWNEERLSANWKTKHFAATADVAAGSYGMSFGWLLNFHTKGFSAFLGMDHTLGNLAKQGLPVSGKGHVNFGINFPL